MAIGLIAMVLLLIAAMTLQAGRGSKGARMDYEARNIGRSLLESYHNKAVDLLPLGLQPPVVGQFANGLDYTATVELYSGGGTGIAQGLSDADFKGIRVRVSWKDVNGQHQEQVEGALVRIAR